MSDSVHQLLFGVYGLAFFSLGLALAVRSMNHQGSALRVRMRALAAFGLLHGFFEWASLFGGVEHYPTMTLSLAAVSFWMLYWFAIPAGSSRPSLRDVVLGVSAVVWLASAATIEDPALLGFIGRYGLGVPAALAVASAMLVDPAFRLPSKRATWAKRFIASGFAAYAVSQLVATPTGLGVGPLVTNDEFQQVFGFPVELARTVLGVIIACSSLISQASIDGLLRQGLESELARAKDLAEQRSADLEVALVQNQHLALHDGLTGLPNRRYLDAHLERRAAGRLGSGGFGVLHVDLDRFKQINDTLGHAAGDHVLHVVATRLRGAVREDDFVSRIGGDEFVVVADVVETCEELSEMADRIIAALSQPIPYQEHHCRTGASIGVAYERGGDFDPRRVLANTDIALYRSKNTGRNRHEFFSASLQAELLEAKRTADDVLRAVENREFAPFYQLQFCASSLDVVGVEALARWRHSKRGMLAPATFLKIAEDLGVAAEIDSMILEQALADFERWRAAGLAVPKVAVNVSYQRLAERTFIESLRELEIPRGALAFELLESIFLDDVDDQVAWNIDQVRELGIEIEIDDFGSGHASIISLLRLAPQRLKIDRQLVTPAVASAAQRRLLRSVVEMGRSLGVEVLAEGVETPEHVAVLRDLGCDCLQGYALARPMSAEALATFLVEQPWRSKVSQGAGDWIDVGAGV